MKVMMAAPFDTKGRYSGGISALANLLLGKEALFQEKEIELSCFETCRVYRRGGSGSIFNLSNFRNFLKLRRAVVSEIKAFGAECLYYHTSCGFALLKDLLVLRRAKRKTAVRTAIHIHFADYEKILTKSNAINKYILKLIKRYVDEIVFLSEGTRKEFIQHGIDEDKCSVIYNFSSVLFSEEEIANKISNLNKPLRFLFVGSIDERKGIFEILDVLSNKDADFSLHVCGIAENESDKRLFESYKEKLGDRLVYHGYVKSEEKRNIYSDCHVLLLPSKGEGLPLVILEAFSSALAVVATDVGAIPEIHDTDGGWLIGTNDKQALDEAISSYIEISGEKLAEQMKYNYMKAVNFSIEGFISSVADVCRKTQK